MTPVRVVQILILLTEVKYLEPDVVRDGVGFRLTLAWVHYSSVLGPDPNVIRVPPAFNFGGSSQNLFMELPVFEAPTSGIEGRLI